MTIRYLDGREVNGTILSHSDTAIRVISREADDVLEFTRVSGQWMSEDAAPVTITFEWQRHSLKAAVSEADCVCSKQLASRLIRLLLAGSEAEEATVDIPLEQKTMSASAQWAV